MLDECSFPAFIFMSMSMNRNLLSSPQRESRNTVFIIVQCCVVLCCPVLPLYCMVLSSVVLSLAMGSYLCSIDWTHFVESPSILSMCLLSLIALDSPIEGWVLTLLTGCA